MDKAQNLDLHSFRNLCSECVVWSLLDIKPASTAEYRILAVTSLQVQVSIGPDDPGRVITQSYERRFLHCFVPVALSFG